MCFREDEYLAVYGDAMVVEIQKNIYDNTRCTYIFVVRYDFLDKAEEKVTLDKICCRPTFINNNNDMPSEIPQVEFEEDRIDVNSS
ncbi:protein SAWADEE HOMEODOMAIN 1-like [Capsicum galapagoense]